MLRQNSKLNKFSISLAETTTFAYRPVLEMNAYWEKHPLYNPIQDEFYSSSIRLFHNGSIKSGGRWYGGWTIISPSQRFSLTIDDQPIVNIDINGMILALAFIFNRQTDEHDRYV